MEVLLKGQLKACLSHQSVHFVGLVFQILVILPLLAVHSAHIAQNMGGILGIVLTDGGGFRIQSGNVQLQNGRQHIVLHILQKHITGQTGHHTTQRQLIAHANDGTGIGFRPFGGDLIDGA